jgi:hypothetical protein
MTQRSLTLPALLALALAACQQPANDSNIAIDNAANTADVANADVETLPPSEAGGAPAGNDAASPSTVNEAEDGGSEDPKLTFIPAQYQGRWGMVPADCTSTRGDAKGLINVGDTSIRFYESTATLKEQRPEIATSFAGLFAFAGEGQTWQKVMTFTRTGATLKRADDEGTFTYKRCA